MALEDAIRYFTEDTHILASMAISCGTGARCIQAMGGARDAQGIPVAEDTIYDLASLTKLFTGLLVMRLHEEGQLALNAPVMRYAPMFTRLGGVSVNQVLGFETGLVTPERVDTQPDREAGLSALYAIAPRDNGDGRAYSDMHAMVLKYVLEGAGGQPYMALARQYILEPLGMAHTFCRVPDALKKLCVSYDGEHRLENGRYLVRRGLLPGTPHDPKARLLNLDGDDCCGHAGLFSTLGDMTRLCQGILNGQVVSRESLRSMARNRTGRALPGGGHTQYLGSQCYVKHPCQYFSEVPVYEGWEALGLSGFTGNHLSVDPENGVFSLYLGNRVLNRLTVLTPEGGKTLRDYGLDDEGAGQLVWEDGSRVWSSVHYVHKKDAHFHNEVEKALQALK